MFRDLGSMNLSFDMICRTEQIRVYFMLSWNISKEPEDLVVVA